MLTMSNTQYNTQRMKTVATVQTFKKQYSFKAWIAAAANPGEGPGGLGSPLCFDHNEARRTENKILDTAPSPPPPFTAAMADPREVPGGPAPLVFRPK